MLTLSTRFGLWCRMRNLSLINVNKILRKQGYNSFRNWKKRQWAEPRRIWAVWQRQCEVFATEASLRTGAVPAWQTSPLLSALPQCASHTSSRKETKPARTLHWLDPVNITPPHCSSKWNLQGRSWRSFSSRGAPVTQPHQVNSCWLILENESINTALYRENNNFSSCFNSGDDQHFCQGGSGCSQGISWNTPIYSQSYNISKGLPRAPLWFSCLGWNGTDCAGSAQPVCVHSGREQLLCHSCPQRCQGSFMLPLCLMQRKD